MPLLATSGAAVGAAALLVVALAAQRGAQPADARAATAKAFGHKALALLATADYPALVPYTCAPGGLGFSPYARNLSSVSPVALSADELLQFKGDVKRRVWGRYDGSGADIALTPMDYHRQFVYDAD